MTLTKLDNKAFEIYIEHEKFLYRPVLSQKDFIYHKNFSKEFYDMAIYKINEERKQKLQKLLKLSSNIIQHD